MPLWIWRSWNLHKNPDFIGRLGRLQLQFWHHGPICSLSVFISLKYLACQLPNPTAPPFNLSKKSPFSANIACGPSSHQNLKTHIHIHKSWLLRILVSIYFPRNEKDKQKHMELKQHCNHKPWGHEWLPSDAFVCVCVLATTCANLFKSPWPPPHFAKSSSRRIAAFSRLCFAGIVLMIKWMACTETLYVLICFTWPWTVLSLATAWAGNMFMFENSPNIASRLPRAAVWLSMEAHTLLCCSLANRTDLILLTFLATIHGSYSGMCFAAWHGKSNCGKRLNWKCIIKLVKMAQAKANDYVLPSNLIEINATWQCCSCNDCKDWKLHIKRNTVTWSPAYHPSAIWEIRNLILPGIPHDSCPKKSEANDLGWKLWPSTKWNKTSPNQTRMKAPHWLHEAASQASCHPKAPQHSEWCRSEKQ